MWNFANKHTKTWQNYHRVIDRLSFIHKPIRCMHLARLWQGTKHPANWYAYSRRSPYPPWYRASCQLWESFSAKVVYQWTLPMKYYATVSQQINCCQTRCWWQFCLKQENAMAHYSCVQLSQNCWSELSSLLISIMGLCSAAQQLTPVIVAFIESHISMSMSREPVNMIEENKQRLVESH